MSDPVGSSVKQLNRRELGKLAIAGALGVAFDWSQPGFAAAQTGGPRQLVLDGATLIDGTGRSPILNAVIVLEGARIKAVGPKGQVPYPAKATVIKLDGL